MEASEAFERHEHVQHATHGHGDGEVAGFATQAALVVAILAAFLAVATFKANEAVKDAIQDQTKVSDTHFESQTQTSRQIELELNYALLNAISINSPAAKQLQDAAAPLNTTANKLDPVIKELDKTAAEQSRSVKHNNNQHLLFELAVVGLQIGIVLASVSIIVRRRWLLFGGAGMGVAGIVVLIIGFAS